MPAKLREIRTTRRAASVTRKEVASAIKSVIRDSMTGGFDRNVPDRKKVAGATRKVVDVGGRVRP